MIVWSGWGIMVPVFVVLAFVACLAGLDPMNLEAGLANEIAYAATGLISGLAVFFVARHIEGKPGRQFTDNATGQAFEVRPSAGSLFFVPTRFWPYILVVAGIALAAVQVFNPAALAPAP